MPISLEDTTADILAKAQRGLKLDDAQVTARAGLSTEQWSALLAGAADAALFARVAPVLGLNGAALAGYADYRPAPVALPGLESFNTPFDDMTVNSYLLWDGQSGDAVAFDTGTDASLLFDALHKRGLRLRLLLLTHTHGDHVLEVDLIRERARVPVWVPAAEAPFDGAEPFEPGREFQCGGLRIETRSTWGHSPGGTTYLVHGLPRPVAVVGDAIFAGSMGGAAAAWETALANNRREILSLPGGTILCPGHGPLTTVDEEKTHNPFYA